MLVENGLELLDEDESWALLRTRSLGRVGVTVAAVPAIFPVNYAVVDDTIVFRTAPGTKLDAAADGATVAFEVDDFDVDEKLGWSVMLAGRAEEVHDLEMTFRVVDIGLEPWAGGTRSHLVRITPMFVSGRRVVRVTQKGSRAEGP
ncbi:MAG TPA: pyridoxamine 5'-phosphate oxidase family protein [Acidimicrobiales bacterium]|nr:pyridoxamine 5'-phosphate oxidase family protein [Acidimicrobiales bacterium]